MWASIVRSDRTKTRAELIIASSSAYRAQDMLCKALRHMLCAMSAQQRDSAHHLALIRRTARHQLVY
jgi:hypothetical protein